MSLQEQLKQTAQQMTQAMTLLDVASEEITKLETEKADLQKQIDKLKTTKIVEPGEDVVSVFSNLPAGWTVLFRGGAEFKINGTLEVPARCEISTTDDSKYATIINETKNAPTFTVRSDGSSISNIRFAATYLNNEVMAIFAKGCTNLTIRNIKVYEDPRLAGMLSDNDYAMINLDEIPILERLITCERSGSGSNERYVNNVRLLDSNLEGTLVSYVLYGGEGTADIVIDNVQGKTLGYFYRAHGRRGTHTITNSKGEFFKTTYIDRRDGKTKKRSLRGLGVRDAISGQTIFDNFSFDKGQFSFGPLEAEKSPDKKIFNVLVKNSTFTRLGHFEFMGGVEGVSFEDTKMEIINSTAISLEPHPLRPKIEVDFKNVEFTGVSTKLHNTPGPEVKLGLSGRGNTFHGQPV